MSAHIGNPLGAYGQRSIDSPTQAVTEEFKASAAITEGQAVKVAVSATGDVTVSPAEANTDIAIGVAAQTVKTGQPVIVVTHGLARIQSAGGNAIAAGVWVQPTTGGRYATAAAGALGTRTALGVVLEAEGATAGALKAIWVNPSMIFAS